MRTLPPYNDPPPTELLSFLCSQFVTVGKRRVEQTQRVSDDVRHEELRVEKDGKEGTKGASPESKTDRKTA